MRSSGERNHQDASQGGVCFEFTPVGGSVKVSAIDVATGTEISVIGPARAARAHLQQLALQKLNARLKRSPKP